MSIIKAEEAIRFFRIYFKVDEDLVKEWVEERNTKANTDAVRLQINENDLYEFNEWCIYKGTAYEEGIDDQTKIARLLEEVRCLKEKIEKLETENRILEDQVENFPF